MNSVELCRSWLRNGALFLDTETTGVDESAEIIEIAVINNDGGLVYESLIRPKVLITPKLTALHGINNEMVAEAPEFWEVYNDLCSKLDGRLIIAYGADFDARMFRQTCELYDLKDGLVTGVVQCRCIKITSAERKELNCQMPPNNAGFLGSAKLTGQERMRKQCCSLCLLLPVSGIESYSVSGNNIVLYFSSASIASRSTTPAMEHPQVAANFRSRQEAELLTKPSNRRPSCFFRQALTLACGSR